jgi:hypothetical protein
MLWRRRRRGSGSSSARTRRALSALFPRPRRTPRTSSVGRGLSRRRRPRAGPGPRSSKMPASGRVLSTDLGGLSDQLQHLLHRWPSLLAGDPADLGLGDLVLGDQVCVLLGQLGRLIGSISSLLRRRGALARDVVDALDAERREALKRDQHEDRDDHQPQIAVPILADQPTESAIGSAGALVRTAPVRIGVHGETPLEGTCADEPAPARR